MVNLQLLLLYSLVFPSVVQLWHPGSCVLVSKQHFVTPVNALFSFPLQKSAILTTVGVLEQPLGNARLHVARLVAALLQTSAPSICQELCNLATMDLLLVSKTWLDTEPL